MRWLTLLMPFLLSGCAVGMAMSNKATPKMSFLTPGTPRATVIEHLGSPELSHSNDNGELVDTWAFVQTGKPSVARAVMHVGLDYLTLGLWELIGTPMERNKRQEVRYVVSYDEKQQVRTITSEKAHPQPSANSQMATNVMRATAEGLAAYGAVAEAQRKEQNRQADCYNRQLNPPTSGIYSTSGGRVGTIRQDRPQIMMPCE